MQSEPPRADPPKRKRRWFQYSLRTLLIFVTLVGLFCGLIVRPALEQRRVVREINALGARVGYDHRNGIFAIAFGPESTWLDRLVGNDFMHTATGVGCQGDHGIDKMLRLAAQLPHLESIDLTACDVTDSDFAAIRGLERLKELRLDSLGMEFSMGIWAEAQRRDPHLTAAALAY